MDSSLLLIWMSSISATRGGVVGSHTRRLRITEILHRGRRISNNEVELWIFWISTNQSPGTRHQLAQAQSNYLSRSYLGTSPTSLVDVRIRCDQPQRETQGARWCLPFLSTRCRRSSFALLLFSSCSSLSTHARSQPHYAATPACVQSRLIIFLLLLPFLDCERVYHPSHTLQQPSSEHE